MKTIKNKLFMFVMLASGYSLHGAEKAAAAAATVKTVQQQAVHQLLTTADLTQEELTYIFMTRHTGNEDSDKKALDDTIEWINSMDPIKQHNYITIYRGMCRDRLYL